MLIAKLRHILDISDFCIKTVLHINCLLFYYLKKKRNLGVFMCLIW